MCFSFVVFFKQKTAYEMRISDWSSDVCSSDLLVLDLAGGGHHHLLRAVVGTQVVPQCATVERAHRMALAEHRATKRPIGIGGFLDVVEHDVVGCVVGLANFLQDHPALPLQQIGRAACRERGLQYGYISVVAVSIKKKT